MFERILNIISKLVSGINIKLQTKSVDANVNGSNNTFKQTVVRDISPSIYINVENVNNHYKGMLNSATDELLCALNIDLDTIIDNPSNYRAFCNVVNQFVLMTNDSNERKKLLSNLLLEKVKQHDEEVDLYGNVIEIVRGLTLRQIKCVALIYFIMNLSRNLQQYTILQHEQTVANLINDVSNLKIEEIKTLERLGVVYSIFPLQFDVSSLECLQEKSLLAYRSVMEWLNVNKIVCGYSITTQGAIMSKSVLWTYYDLSYEDISGDDLPVKGVDLYVGNLYSSGGVTSGGSITFGAN